MTRVGTGMEKQACAWVDFEYRIEFKVLVELVVPAACSYTCITVIHEYELAVRHPLNVYPIHKNYSSSALYFAIFATFGC